MASNVKICANAIFYVKHGWVFFGLVKTWHLSAAPLNIKTTLSIVSSFCFNFAMCSIWHTPVVGIWQEVSAFWHETHMKLSGFLSCLTWSTTSALFLALRGQTNSVMCVWNRGSFTLALFQCYLKEMSVSHSCCFVCKTSMIICTKVRCGEEVIFLSELQRTTLHCFPWW